MSLYNAIFGTNPMAPFLLKMLGIDQPMKNAPVLPPEADSWHPNYDEKAAQNFIQQAIKRKYYISGRFRDAWLNSDGMEIHIYTRNGGGNREEYWYVFKILRSHPQYLRDIDDEFDSTYATIVFRVPDKWLKYTQKIAGGKTKRGDKIWGDFLKDLQEGENTKEVQKAIETGKRIFDEMDKGKKIIGV